LFVITHFTIVAFSSQIEKVLVDRAANEVSLDDVLGLLAFGASLLGPKLLPVLLPPTHERQQATAGRTASDDDDDGDGGGSRDGSPCDVSELEPMLVDALWEERELLPPVCAKIGKR
jgi:hypothetical protein